MNLYMHPLPCSPASEEGGGSLCLGGSAFLGLAAGGGTGAGRPSEGGSTARQEIRGTPVLY